MKRRNVTHYHISYTTCLRHTLYSIVFLLCLTRLSPQTQFRCRMEGCPKVYKYRKARDTHELKCHGLQLQPEEPTPPPTPTMDHKTEHSVARLSFGFFLMNLHDAVREGDGKRLLKLYKVALLYYRAYGHTQYAHSTFLLSVQLNATLSPNLVHNLTWNRFWNTRGGKATNISLDLHLEHLNNFLKSFLRGLGANLTEQSAKRISRSISILKHLLDATDTELGVAKQSGRHCTPDQTNDIRALVQVALEEELFASQAGREFNSFPGFDRNLMSKLNYTEFRLWMRSRLREWRLVPI